MQKIISEFADGTVLLRVQGEIIRNVAGEIEKLAWTDEIAYKLVGMSAPMRTYAEEIHGPAYQGIARRKTA